MLFRVTDTISGNCLFWGIFYIIANFYIIISQEHDDPPLQRSNTINQGPFPSASSQPPPSYAANAAVYDTNTAVYNNHFEENTDYPDSEQL